MEVTNRSLPRKEAPQMPHSNPGSFRAQVGFLRRQFLQDGELPFTNVLTEEVIAQALAALGGWLDRIFSPLVTLWVFLGQVLGADHSCRAAGSGRPPIPAAPPPPASPPTAWPRGKPRAPPRPAPTARPASACPSPSSPTWRATRDRPWMPRPLRGGCGSGGAFTSMTGPP